MTVFELDHVDLAYAGGVLALADVDLSISAGQVVGLVGENGAGKTTLMRIAMGMMRPRRGTVRLVAAWIAAAALVVAAYRLAQHQFLRLELPARPSKFTLVDWKD